MSLSPHRPRAPWARHGFEPPPMPLPERRRRLFGRNALDLRIDITLDAVLQALIAVLTIAGLWLVTSGGVDARWGFVVSLAAQPFWLYATWRKRQWGMWFVAVVYSAAWLRGIVNTF